MKIKTPFVFLVLLLMTGGYGEADTSWEDSEIYDRFFDPSVYKKMGAHPHTPTGVTPEARNYRQKIAKQALDKFVALAAERGIQPKDITQAMFAGKLNPHWVDLTLVNDGLGHPPGIVDPYSSSVPQGDVAFYRNQAWTRFFGALTKLQATRLGQRLRYFDHAGLRDNSLALYQRNQNSAAFQAKLADLSSRHSAYSYFYLGSRRDPAFDLAGEYQRYRRQYIAMLKAERSRQ